MQYHTHCRVVLRKAMHKLVMLKTVRINSDSFAFKEKMTVSERRYLKKNTTNLCRGQIYAV